MIKAIFIVVIITSITLPLKAQWVSSIDTLEYNCPQLSVIDQNVIACSGDYIYFSGNTNLMYWRALHWFGSPVYGVIKSGNSIVVAAGSVYVSTDNGSTFKSSPIWGGVRKLAKLGNNLFAARQSNASDTSAGLWHSTDDGSNWNPLDQTNDMGILSIIAHGNELFISTSGEYGREGGFYSSYDNGINWNPLTYPFRDSIAVDRFLFNFGDALIATGTNAVFVPNDSNVFISFDEGYTWSAMKGLSGRRVRDVTSVGSDCFAATDRGVYQYRVGASSWSKVTEELADHDCSSITVCDTMLLISRQSNKVLIWHRPLSEFEPRPLRLSTWDFTPGCEGESNFLVIDAFDGNRPYTYKWTLIDGSPIPLDQFLYGRDKSTDSIIRLVPTHTLNLMVTVTDAFGQVQTSSQSMKVLPKPKPAITQLGLELICNIANAKYQWLDSQGNEIAGATYRRYQPTTSGSYSVKVTVNTCDGISPSFAFSLSTQSAYSESSVSRFLLYPNPATTELHIEGAGVTEEGILVYDVFGRCLENCFTHPSVSSADVLTYDLNGVAAGMYFVQTRGGRIGRFVKE